MIDATNLISVDTANTWKKDIDQHITLRNINQVILLVDNIDVLDETGRSNLNYDDLRKEYDFNTWIAISTKTGENIDLAHNMMLNICTTNFL